MGIIEKRIEHVMEIRSRLYDRHDLGRQRPDGSYFFRLTREARKRELQKDLLWLAKKGIEV